MTPAETGFPPKVLVGFLVAGMVLIAAASLVVGKPLSAASVAIGASFIGVWLALRGKGSQDAR